LPCRRSRVRVPSSALRKAPETGAFLLAMDIVVPSAIRPMARHWLGSGASRACRPPRSVASEPGRVLRGQNISARGSRRFGSVTRSAPHARRSQTTPVSENRGETGGLEVSENSGVTVKVVGPHLSRRGRRSQLGSRTKPASAQDPRQQERCPIAPRVWSELGREPQQPV